jgi:holliday junction DNA helicase RuvB
MLQVDNHKQVDELMLLKLFALLEMDNLGLTKLDLNYLYLIAEKFQNSAVGVGTIASSLTEDIQTVEEFIEPYLLQMGLIKKTPRGRIVTNLAIKHLGIKQSKTQLEQQNLI